MRLARLVRAHQPYDEPEAESQDATLRLLRHAPRPFDRSNVEPGHVVGSACIVAGGRLALVFHARLERWLQPGGHLEPSENAPVMAAVREAREELGLELDADRASLLDIDVHQIPAGRDPSHLHFDLRYLFATAPGPLRPRTDALDARWVSMSEAQGLALDHGLLRIFAKCAARGLVAP